MASFTLAVTAPHATAYDSDYPTRSTENYSHALHDVLQDMEDAGFKVADGSLLSAERTNLKNAIHDSIEGVFDYAEDAIQGWRASSDPGLTKPSVATTTLTWYYTNVQWINEFYLKLHAETYRMKYLIYYMWETEVDPLLLKEKLQELLIAWPLTDLTVELNTEAGQEMKVYPSWKNVDI